MPLYEFRCQNCHATFSIMVRNVGEPFTAGCSVCGSKDVARVISRFAYHKSTGTIWEESGEPQFSPGTDYYKDPRNIGRWTEKKFREVGMEVPPEIKKDIQAAREGELPDALKE